MKIGIITYHFAINYGAVLQCYALSKFLESKGYEIEVINYVNSKQKRNNDVIKHDDGIKSLIANCLLLPFRGKIKNKKYKFETFVNKIKLSKEIQNIDELKEYINSNNFNVIISGSDQVFNPKIDDFDLAFLLPFDINCKKVSYAASTGNANTADINKLKKYLDKFDRLSIREVNDLEKFRNIDRNINVVCDPTLLLSKNDWKMLSSAEGDSNYLLCYFLHKDLFKKEFMVAKKIAKEKHLKIKIINSRYSKNSLRKGTIFDCGPEEFIDLFANADYICTDSFHGTVFSLIFEKKFLCFDTSKNKNDSRRKNLLLNTDMIDALYLIDSEKDFNKISYDYINCRKKIKNMQKDALDFLENNNDK